MSGLKGQCSNCGWNTRRSLKNMNKKPCPKCGGQVYIHEEDRGTAIFIIIVTVVFAVLMAAITGNW